MAKSVNTRPQSIRQRLRGVVWYGPTPVVACVVLVVWGVVTYSAWMKWYSATISQPRLGWLGFVALLVFAASFVTSSVLGRKARRVRQMLLLLDVGAVLLAYVLLQDVSITLLLAVIAAQFAASFKRATSLLLIAIINAIIFWLFTVHLPMHQALEDLAFVCGLQLFTFMTAAYALDGREARDALMASNAELLATKDLLSESVRLDERLRLTRELHDIAGYNLIALKLHLRQFAKHGQSGDKETILQCTQLVDTLLKTVRDVVSASRYGDGVDLTKPLQTLVNNFPRPGIQLRISENARAQSVEQAEALFRAVQEGLTNAVRHGDAHQILVSLEQSDNDITLIIDDDGQCQTIPRYGNGLTGMRERLEAIKGSLDVTCPKLHGLRLTVHIPIQDSATL